MVSQFVFHVARTHQSPEQFLQSPLQLEHACDILIASELFTFHSERMCDILSDEAHTVRRPRCALQLGLTLIRSQEHRSALPTDSIQRHPHLRAQKRQFLPLAQTLAADFPNAHGPYPC